MQPGNPSRRSSCHQETLGSSGESNWLATSSVVRYLPKTQVPRLRQTAELRLSFVSHDDICCCCSMITPMFGSRLSIQILSPPSTPSPQRVKLRAPLSSQRIQSTVYPSFACQAGFSASYRQPYHELHLVNHQEGEANQDYKKRT